MPKRLFWFTAGAGAGAAGASYVRRKLRQATRRPAAPRARAATDPSAKVKAAVTEARAALAEGTAAVRRYRADVARGAVEDRKGR